VTRMQIICDVTVAFVLKKGGLDCAQDSGVTCAACN